MADQLKNCFDKFQSIWQAGNDARLHLECHAGQVWVHLQIHPVQPHPQQKQPGPSRLRCRARRTEARAAGTAATAAPPVNSAAASAEMAVYTGPMPIQHHPGQEVPDAQADLQPGEQAHHFPMAHARDVFCPDEEAAPLPHDVQLGIPQLDVAAEAHSFKCDNCSKPFKTRSQLQHHDDKHQFGCDDCSLFYIKILC